MSQHDVTAEFRPSDASTLAPIAHVDRSAPTDFAPPGFEILGELGRGGMGVVYRARQISLNRSVALKVILGAGHAGKEQLVRFRAEATTAAQLQHPNIVQVFEVGEHNGQPFFSLELIEGGSLADRLNGEPQPPRSAAELVRVLALAVEHAHERGVVHRDLKPANILVPKADWEVDEKGSESNSAFRNPQSSVKITDFGLAKQQSAGSDLTASGAILGTPSYMAPEQAGGHGRSVGPLADVYALGAILYECLTGRPPFRGPTVMDTVLQVLGDEPIPPSRLQPKLPRDLETICLKCLAKKPEQRYASAAALADDLGRFLADESILARPASGPAKVWKWARRHPALAFSAFVLAVPMPALLAVMIFLWSDARAAKRSAEDEKRLADVARQTAEHERSISQGYLKNAVVTLDQVLTRLSYDKFARYPEIQEDRHAIFDAAVAFYDSLLRLDSSEANVRYQSAVAQARVSRLSTTTGQLDRSAAASQQAIDQLSSLAAEFPDHPEYRHEMAKAYQFLGHARIMKAQYPEGIKAYTQSAEIASALAKDYPDVPSYGATASQCFGSIGSFYSLQNPSRAEEQFRKAIAAAETHPGDPEQRASLANVLVLLGQVVLKQRSREREAIELADRAAKLLETPLPNTVGFMARNLFDQGRINIKSIRADVHIRARRYSEAAALLVDVVQQSEDRLAAQPGSFPQLFQAAQNNFSHASVLDQVKDYPKAVAAASRAVELMDRLLRDFPAMRDPSGLGMMGFRTQMLGMKSIILAHAGRFAEAEKLADEIELLGAGQGIMAYNSACVFALMSADLTGQEKERSALRAMACLKKAAASGYPANDGQLRYLRVEDDDLKPLRGRKDFQEWAATLKVTKK